MRLVLISACAVACLAATSAISQGISKGVGSLPVAESPDVAPVTPEPETPRAEFAGLLASDPASIQAAMLNEGFQARLTTNSNGNPMITGRISKTDYWVYFLDCVDNARCKGIQLHSGYILNRAIDTVEINDFNSRYRYVRAWLNDEGYPRMQMDLLMRDDGMGPKTFATYLDLWRQLIGHWENQLGI